MGAVRWLCTKRGITLEKLQANPMASIRLRIALCASAALNLGYDCTFSDGLWTGDASIVFVGKLETLTDPTRPSRWLDHLRYASKNGVKIVVDYTDHHLAADTATADFYRKALRLADVVVCSSTQLLLYLQTVVKSPIVFIDDPIEVDFARPRPPIDDVGPRTALWFGHGSNLPYLLDYLERDYPKDIPLRLILMSNSYPLAPVYADRLSRQALSGIETHAVRWTLLDMQAVAGIADFCLLPAGIDDPRKRGASANRLLTALAMGLPVAADRLPSYEPFQSYFQPLRGEGLMKLMQDPSQWHPQVIAAQEVIAKHYTFRALEPAWGNLIRSLA